jgi:circadian clock protein KaiB
MATPRHRTPATKQKPDTPGGKPRYVLRLYVAGLTTRSAAAIRNVKTLCEEHLRERYDLEVVDLYDHPTLARGEQIIAAPTLIKQLPLPLRRLIGDMADDQRVLIGLDLQSQNIFPEDNHD